VARTNLVLDNVARSHGVETTGEEGYKFVKFLEDSGRTIDPKTGLFSIERVTQQMQWMQSVIAALNARVTGADLFQLRQSGKASVNTLSDQGLTNLLPAIQSLGPVAVGTALQGAQQQLLGAVQLRQQTVDWLEHYGMLDPSKAHKGKGGFFKLDPGAITGEQLMQHDLGGWIWSVLEPHMAAMGLSREQMTDEIKRSGLRTPLLGLIAELIQNETVQKKEIGNVARAGGADQYDVMNKESPTFQVTKFTEAWENLMKALGSPLVTTATTALGFLTSGINAISQWALAHPDTARVVGQVAAALSALAIAVGAIAVGAAVLTSAGGMIALSALGGPVGIIAGLGIAAGLAVANIKALREAVEGLWNWLGTKTNAQELLNTKTGHRDRNEPQGPPEAPTSPGGHWGLLNGKQRFIPDVAPPPPQGEQHSENTTIINFDGRKIAEVVSNYMARGRPSNGTTGPDIRNSPLMPGVAYG
jgi:hypothetical protein